MKTLLIAFLILWPFGCPAADAQEVKADELTYMVSLYPPFSYEENGQLKGLNIEIIEQLWKEMGLSLGRDKIIVNR